ncbi:MAG: type II toxin-antitoxin system Phd/YefM family antitoxin [Deltaproteobacteria bacterium]|nr:type II toxin-antitoxin system Phd/YefM family antitoxin [Deltaproteobacteria bacterium]
MTRLAADRHARRSLSNQIRSDIVPSMKTLSVTEVARNFSAVLDTIERDQEEIVLVRNRRQIARLVPEAQRQDAMEVFGDLYRTLDDKTADALSAAVASLRKRRRGRVSESRNPWAG